MGIFDRFRSRAVSEPAAARVEPVVRASVAPGGGDAFNGLDDPRLLEYIRRGEYDGGDLYGERRLKNMALLRCVALISNSIGMMPVNLMASDETRTVQASNPAHKLLRGKPNTWQTPSELKTLVTMHALLDGNGYARVIRSPLDDKPIAIVPCRRHSTFPRMLPGFELVYQHVDMFGKSMTLPARDVLHLRDVTLDGIHGISRLRLGHRALDLAESTEKATANLFKRGVMAAGAIEVTGALSDQAYERMKTSIEEDHGGADNFASWFVLEEGAKANPFSTKATDAQQIDNRNHQIEEIARMYGVPRPLLMMSDTSWGSGIEQLAIFFIQYGLAPWFVKWEEALSRVMLTDDQANRLMYKFDESMLLRGTLNDQAAFFSKALGAGGSAPWMSQNEVREAMDFPRSDDPVADQLRNPMTQKPQGKENTNDVALAA